MAGYSCVTLLATALLVALLTTLTSRVHAAPAPVDDTLAYPQYTVEAVPEESVQPSDDLLIRKLLNGIRQSQMKFRPARKRTCLFNGGMSHSCDYKDLVGAMDEAKYLNSMYNPGKRRRRSV